MKSLQDDVHALYDALPAMEAHPDLSVIHPHVGGAFLDARPGTLRVLAVGINSYVDDEHAHLSKPGWFTGWVRARSHRFFPKLRDECEVIAEVVTKSPAFDGLGYADLDSLYATNAVKRYLPRAGGRWASDVEGCWLDEGAVVWRAELDAMARHGVLPHVVIVFGQRIWGRCWRAFGDPSVQPGWVEDYRPLPRSSPVFHRLNKIYVQEDGVTRLMLLIRLTHPAAPTNRWRAAELIAHSDFRSVLGLL